MGIRSVLCRSEFSPSDIPTNDPSKSNISIGQAADSGLWDQYMPFYDVYSSDVRCGRGASSFSPGTKTATVLAGDEIGFIVGRSAYEVQIYSTHQFSMNGMDNE